MDSTNKIKFYRLMLVLITFFLSGCDFLDTDTQKIVGNLYVNYAQSISKGYILVVMDGSGQNDNISEDYIRNITGNDTVLLIKAVPRNDSSVSKLYVLHHSHGLKSFSLKGISAGEYYRQLKMIDDKYYFVARPVR